MTLPQGKRQFEITWRLEGRNYYEPEIVNADEFSTEVGWVEFWTKGDNGLPSTLIMKVNANLVRSVKMVEKDGD